MPDSCAIQAGPRSRIALIIGGQRPRFTRTGDIKLNGLMRLMEPMMKGMATKRADGFLANLKQKLEAS